MSQLQAGGELLDKAVYRACTWSQ